MPQAHLLRAGSWLVFAALCLTITACSRGVGNTAKADGQADGKAPAKFVPPTVVEPKQPEPADTEEEPDDPPPAKDGTTSQNKDQKRTKPGLPTKRGFPFRKRASLPPDFRYTNRTLLPVTASRQPLPATLPRPDLNM